MADTFGPITTQEDFQARVNDIVQERLRREREAANKRYEGWMSPDDHQRALGEVTKAFDDYKKAHEKDEQTIADLTAKTKAYETASLKSRISHEVGLPWGSADFLTGEDEESIRTSAETLKSLVGTAPAGNVLPLKDPESGSGTGTSTRDKFKTWFDETVNQ